MKLYPQELEQLIEFFKKLPGIGEKSAERMALSVLELDEDYLQISASNLIEAKKRLHPCCICGNLTNQEVCDICANENRDHSLICVIEDYKSVFAFEKAGNYRGVYHVLNGLISPIDDVGIEDINLSSLIKRVESLENPELILALKSSIEGETTIDDFKKSF